MCLCPGDRLDRLEQVLDEKLAEFARTLREDSKQASIILTKPADDRKPLDK